MTLTTTQAKKEKQTPFQKKAKSEAAAKIVLPQDPRCQPSAKSGRELLSDWIHAS